MNEFRSNFSEVVERAEQLALQAWSSLESFTGGMINNIDQLANKFTLAKMKLMATLAFVMGVASACGGGSPDAVTPGTPAAVDNATAVATESMTPIVSDKPAGFGETPGAPNTVPTETPVPEHAPGSIYEKFVAPTSADYARMKASDPEVPAVLAGPESIARKAMENNDVLRDVADQCGIDLTTDKLEVVYFEGTVETQFRWGDYYRAVDSTGAVFTCWPSVKSTGELGQYPAYFNESTGKLMSSESGIGWVKLPGEVDVFGTTVGLLNETGYIVPGGLTVAEVTNTGNWNKLAQAGEVTGTESNPTTSPFSRENMAVANEAGWIWNAQTGTLNAPGNNEILLFQEGILYDGDGNELKVEDLQFLKVNGVDEYGLPMKLILEKTVKDENGTHTEIYVQKTNEWRSTVGYEPGAASEADYKQWNVVTIQDVESGFLRELKLAQQYKWPEGTLDPHWYVSSYAGSTTGLKYLSYLSEDDGGAEYKDQLFPNVPMDMYLIASPDNPKLMLPLALSQHKGPSGEDVVFATAFGLDFVTGKSDAGETIMQGYFKNGNQYIRYIVDEDNNNCKDLPIVRKPNLTIANEVCGFWPPSDPRWEKVSYDTILSGETDTTRSSSKPIDSSLFDSYQDGVLMTIIN